MTPAKGISYSLEYRQDLVRRAQEGESVSSLCKETGVSSSALYNWLKQAKAHKERISSAVVALPQAADQRSSAEKFHVVAETYAMNEAELAEYCRRQGLYPEQVHEWRENCQRANVRKAQGAQQKDLQAELREEKKSKALLERELKRKEKALAEAAALLILRKKAEAFWGIEEE